MVYLTTVWSSSHSYAAARMDFLEPTEFPTVACVILALCILVVARGWYVGTEHAVAIHPWHFAMIAFLMTALIFGGWDPSELGIGAVLGWDV